MAIQNRSQKNSIQPFNKSLFIDKDVEHKITYWILKVLVKMGGYREFIGRRSGFDNDELALYLGLDKYVEDDDFEYNEPFEVLQEKLSKLSVKKSLGSNKNLDKNLQRLSKLIGLNKNEIDVLEFFILVKQYDLFERALRYFGNELNGNQALKLLSELIEIPYNEIATMFKSDSIFSKTSLLYLNKRNTTSLGNKFELISDNFAEDLLALDEDPKKLFKAIIKECSDTQMEISNYVHIKEDLNIMLSYLKNGITHKNSGMNILLYGVPGTGKTELAKLVAKELSCNLNEISYSDSDDEPIHERERIKAYRMAQALFHNENTLLMYDEAEDIFDSGGGFFGTKKQKDKAWINRILETNSIPTIWISNDIDSIDNAIIRRFDLCIEVPIPNKKQRIEILKNYSQGLISDDVINKVAQHEKIAPAVISSAMKVANSVSTNKEETFELLLNNTLKAQGYKEIDNPNSSVALPKSYDPKYINTNIDLISLERGITQSQNARICIYGPAGTGKSAFGRYISEQLDRPLIIKKGSDIISKWVGETEKNIARAFYEAKEEKAVLVFDEVDSFLSDRQNASKSWEITQVNEMLTQMESFDGIFIATTNLIDNLDRASLRRFDQKMEFSYLKPDQAYKLFLNEAKQLGIKNLKQMEEEIMKLRFLTPGDFAAVRRQNRFNPIKNANDFIKRLEEEVAIKNVANNKKIGFL